MGESPLNLKSLNLRVTYRSVDSDILNDFYIPCLMNSTLYKRAVGYFTSAALSEAARGLLGLVRNEGRMVIVASPRLIEEDIRSIEEGYELREVVRKALERGLEQHLLEPDVTRVQNLTWMISNGKLDIRIAVPESKDNEGIYHEKIGLFYDPNGNIVTFSGSLNETASGLISNYESIDVSVSWDEGIRERDRVKDHVEHFDRLWKGTAPGLIVMDFPDAVKRTLIEKYKPEKPTVESPKKRNPYPFQIHAIDAWENAHCKGVLAMATGSGKTYTALKALERCKELRLSIIVVPSQDLVYQWENEIKLEYGENSIIRRAHSEEENWKDKVNRLIDWLKNYDSGTKRAFIITTLHTASKENFLDLANDFPEDMLGIIVDEVHHAGAPVFRKALDINAKFRLGLSATPEREWDEEGNQAIFDYFGHVVYEYDISDAIRDGYLSKYYYHPHIVSLSYEERNAFNEVSGNIATMMSKIHSEYPITREMAIPRMLQHLENIDPELSSKLRALFLRRVEIVKKAQNKSIALRQIIKNYKLKRCLVYCNDLDHLKENIRIIYEEGLEPIEFSSRIKPDARKTILQSFENSAEKNTLLVAVKCLDEGVDIPACDSAILISCSRSTREFIQRRGRVLRKHSTKEFSTIHDIVVLPFTNDQEAYPLTSSEFNFAKEELRRVGILSKNALNNKDFNVETQIELYRRYLFF